MHVLGDATVHTHDLLVDESCKWHVVEAIPESLPQGDLVPSLDLIEEAVDPGDGLTLVVASQDDNLVRVFDLQGEKEADDLTALLSSVDIVAHEQVSRRLGDDLVTLLLLVLVCHLLEHVEQIGVLTVDIAENFHWRLELDKSFLVLENLLNFLD